MADAAWFKQIRENFTPTHTDAPFSVSGSVTLLHTLENDTATIYSVAWSPDGKQLASGSEDQTVRLWDPSRGTLLHTLQRHTSSVWSVAWSPDGRQLASGSFDRTVRLWDPSRGTLLRTLEGHTNSVWSVAWSPDGKQLASGSEDRTVRLWDPSRGTLLHTLQRHTSSVWSVAWSPDGRQLASGSFDRTVRLWDPSRGTLLRTLEGHTDVINSLAWSPDGKQLASGSPDGTVRLWDPSHGTLMHLLESDMRAVIALAWSPDGKQLASGSRDGMVRLWDPSRGTLLRTLERHTNSVWSVAWSPDGKQLASSSCADFPPHVADVYIWHTDTWSPVAELAGLERSVPIIWHPHIPLIVTPGRNRKGIFICRLDPARPQQTTPSRKVPQQTTLSRKVVHYASAKVVLVGDSGVGKSGLALVLTGRPFAPTDSTHGRHIWPLDQQEIQPEGEPQEKRELWLWDLAGQRDYRLIHQLHLHEATVALIVFDAARDADPFAGIRHWHRALRLAQQAQSSAALPLTILLVAARIDRGGRSVSRTRIDNLVQELGCVGYIETSAKDGRGIAELGQAIRAAIDWAKLPKVTSTELLQAIKAFVLREQLAGRLLRTADDLYDAFLRSDNAPAPSSEFSQQFERTLGRLEAQGMIRWLGFGNLILLQPERLDAYASALLIAAKDDTDSLGSILEARVQQGQFSVPAEDRLSNPGQEKLLLIAMIDELVRNQLVMREGGSLLFPSQLTREHPDYAALVEKQTVGFTFAGPVLSLYTTLVVRLAQSGVFQKQDLWQHVVTYTTRLGGTYGLLLSPRGEERADLGLFFDDETREEMRFHFEDFVQRHLERHAGGTVQRQRRFVCPSCGFLVTEQLVQLLSQQALRHFACPVCGTNIPLLDREERLTTQAASPVTAMEQAADIQRKRESATSILQGKIETQDFDVFLCHHGQDKPAVKQIGEQLKLNGILPWLDEWELRPGLPWQRLLEEQIARIKTVAVFVGKDGIGPWQRQELDAFLRAFVKRGCPVVPVLLPDAPQEPALPVFLEAMTWVDFRLQDPDPMQQLLWGITGKRERVKGMQGNG